MYSARVEPGGREFTVKPDEPVLDAALRSGIPLRYGCRHGNCSSCKYQLTEGEVDHGNASPYSLSEAERDEGWALLCCATALEDLEIQDDRPVDQRRLPALAPEESGAEVLGVAALTSVLYRLRLRLDRPVVFYAGQFMELGVPGRRDQWRSYSIASAPGLVPDVDFVVRTIEGGAFSGGLGALAPGTSLRLRGPFGTGYLRPGKRPVLLVATGSGIAPILSILEHAARVDDRRAFTFCYGARTAADLPCESRLVELGRSLDLSYHPVLSRPAAGGGWSGASGRVTATVRRLVGDGAPYDAYVCGRPAMCETVTALLEAKGTAEENIFADRFFPAVATG